MRAAMWPAVGSPIELVDIERPAVEAAGQVVIAVESAMFGAALLRALTTGHPKIKPPRVLGTLVVGEVVEIAPDVTNVAVGDKVTIDPHPACGSCANCADGLAALCSDRHAITPGAHSEYVRLDADLSAHLRRVPPTLATESALFTEIVACVLDATRTAGDLDGKHVLVIGCGFVAMVQIQLALLARAASVHCTVNKADRLELVSGLGARAIDISREDPADVMSRFADGRGPHVVFEAVGRASTYEQAVSIVRAGGTVVGFGGASTGTQVTLDPNRIHYDRLKIVGAYHYGPGVFDDALELLSSGRVSVSQFVTRRLTLEDLPNVVELLSDNADLAVVVKP